MKIKRGSTSVRRLIFIGDSSSTTGAGLASLLHNTSGLVAYYFAGDLSNEVQITLATATLGSYTSGGFIAVDNTNMPGWYEIGIPDAALDGGNEVAIQLRGAANMVPVNIYIELDTVDYQTDAFGALKPTTAGRTLDVSAGGEAGIDLANVGSPSTTLNLSGTTIKTATDIEVDTQDIQNRLPSGLVGGRMASIAEVVGDKTGYKLASDGLSLVTSWAVGITGNITGNLSGSVGSVTGNVGGNVTGSVGSISGVTFPASFGTWTAPLTTSGTASAVWDALIASYTVANSFGSRVLRTDSASAGNAAKVTSAGHVAADIHELQPAVINNTHFAAGAIDANAIAADAIGASELAADAVTEIGVGVWLSPGYAAAIRSAIGMAAADLDAQLDAIPADVWNSGSAPTSIRAAMGLASANLDSQLAAALVLQKLAASGATGSVQVTDNGNGTATLVFKDTNGSTTLATVTYNYTSGARTRVS